MFSDADGQEEEEENEENSSVAKRKPSVNQRSSETIICCDHRALIVRQFEEIESLENQLALLKCERDALALHNEKLLFQLQMFSEASSRHNLLNSDNIANGNNTASGTTHNCTNNSLRCVSVLNSIADDEQSFVIMNQANQSSMLNEEVHLRKRRGKGGAMDDNQLVQKYGQQAEESAIIIQRAFRSFRVRRKFVDLAEIAAKLKFCNSSTGSSHALTNSSLSSSSSSSCTVDSTSTSSTFPSVSRVASTNTLPHPPLQHPAPPFPLSVSLSSLNSELVRKRRYRVALNLFNKLKASKGLAYLIEHGFVEDSPEQIANFLLTRKGLSKQMIGEFLGEPNDLNQSVLKAFLAQIDFSTTMTVDLALRKFQSFFRFPGEAQKIERILEMFANHLSSSPAGLSLNLCRDEIFILSFALIMLNTDLHTPSNKQRMTSSQWIKNLSGVFKEGDLDQEFLLGLYDRVKQSELRTGTDHCSHVLRVQQSLCVSSSSNKPKLLPNLCVTWRRLVCFCRLYEIPEKQKLLSNNPNKHQREIFLFNDLLLITKTVRKSTQTFYQFRDAIPLLNLCVSLFSNSMHPHGIKFTSKVDDKLLLLFNARNDLDRQKFVDDLKESILEVIETEKVLKQSLDPKQQKELEKSPLLLATSNSFHSSLSSSS